MRVLSLVACLVISAMACAPVPAAAQALRTWVSGVGDDANPCSRTSPCKTFAGAISKTAAAGEISVLDPGGFGSVTITKAISIVAESGEGSILATGTAGIIINAGTTDVVSIRGLLLEGAGTGTSGIRILQAGSVYLSNVVVRGFKAAPGQGIDVEGANAPLRVYVDNARINDNIVGLYVHAGTSANAVVLDSSILETNSSNTIVADTPLSVVTIFNARLAQTPVSLAGGGKLISLGNNYIVGTTAPTSTTPLK